jgi:Transposase IS116/IS110/IS902 family
VLKAAGHPQAATKAPQIWQRLHQPQLQADPVLTRAKARLMLTLVAQLQVLVPQIAAYDQEITRLFLTHSDSRAFARLPGAGTRLAPRLLADWGDERERYADAASVQARAGPSPVALQSGKFVTVHRRYACSKPLRQAVHQFAGQSTLQEPWARAYYQRKRREGKSHSMAVRALANQWVRLIYALWTARTTYDATIFLTAQQTHAPRAA